MAPAIKEGNLKPPLDPKEDLGDWLIKRIEEEVKRFKGYDMAGCLDSFMDDRGLLVMFDGADEIAAEHYDAMQSALNNVSERLAAKSGNNIVILTMRSQFHVQVRHNFAQQYPTVLHVKAFRPSDIFSLLNKWPCHANTAEHAARIYADLSDRPSLGVCPTRTLAAPDTAPDSTAYTNRPRV